MLKIRNHIVKIILFSCAMFYTFAAFAVEITAIDFNGSVIGQVISTGLVIDANGAKIGSITADSLIINDSGEIIGGVVPQGVAIGNDNRFLGNVHGDGIVRGISGKELGRALPNGLVLDKQSEVIGAVLFPGLVYSDQGKTIGRVTGAGVYANLDGQNVGFVSANGYAYRRSGDEYILDGKLISSKMVVSEEGKFIGSLAPTGAVINFEGKEIGQIHANNFVYNTQGRIVGKLVHTSYAFDLSGKYIGIVTYNGEVSQNGRIIGHYRSDGNIINEKGVVIGFAVEISATAADKKGNYLGILDPNGNILKGRKVVGTIGARGYVYKNDQKIGEIIQSGPMHDTLGKLRGQIMKNGDVVSLNGGLIGKAHGRYAYGTNGTLLGASSNGLLAIDNSNNALGMVNIDSNLINGGIKNKVSPFGYVFNTDGKVIGNAFEPYAIYGVEGLLYSYLTPNGKIYQGDKNTHVTPNGVLLSKNGYIGGIINPLYNVGFNGKNLGIQTQTNIILNAKGEIEYKILPNGSVVPSPQKIMDTIMPVDGFAHRKMVALNIGGDLLGYVDSTASVTNLEGRETGHVVYGDYIMDNNNAVIGQAIPFAVVTNDKCGVLGVINGRGDIINTREVIAGRLLPNGQAISDVGSYIGYTIPQNGLIDFDGNYIGTVNSGQGVDFAGKPLGCVNRQGQIIDENQNMRYGLIENNPVIDFDNSFIGFVMPNGNVANTKGQIIGYMQPNGNVVSKSKKNLGQTFKYKVAYDNENRFLGMVQPDGKVKNQQDKTIGQVQFDGSVRQNGEEIGYALYDFYVYDENFVTYGYLTKDGVVLSMVGSKLGTIDRGFVLDRNAKVIARVNRDYIVRDASNNAIGELHLDGTVSDFSGKNVGYLADGGAILNSESQEIAHATPLQYYTMKQQAPKVEEKKEKQKWVDNIEIPITDIKDGEVIPSKKDTEDQNSDEGKAGSKVVGIALSPDGDVIGNIYDDDSVRNQDGTQIGFRTPDGIVVDMNYNPIGIEEVKHVSAENMFVPENAFGSGNPYGIGSKPSNLGPGGGYGPGERYDPARKAALGLRQNIKRRQTSHGVISSNVKVSSFTGYEEDGWPGQNRAISTWRVDMSEMILQDKAIPAVLARSVYASDGFNENIPITAIVERNVYAEEGRNIIIPAGSRVIGSLGGETGESGGNSGGAVKIGITWNRLIRPDGSQFTFSGAQTADAQGRSGAIGYLDEQLMKKYSVPMLYSALETAMVYFLKSGHGTTTSNNGTTTESSASQAANDARNTFVEQMQQMFEDLIKKKENIRAVTYIPAGTRIIIFPNQDLWLNSEEREKKKGGAQEGGDYASNETGLTESNPNEETDPQVTYNGGAGENVRPVGGGAQGANAGGRAGGDNLNQPPPSTQGTISNGEEDIPDLL